MSCTELQALFDAEPRPNGFAELVDQHSPDCRCETGKVSALSQSPPVEDGEQLIRIVVAPRDAADQSPISFEERFSLSLAMSGFSVLREDRATAAEIVALAHKLAGNAADALPSTEIVEVIGVLRFVVRAARERRFPADHKPAPNGRKICVYETPLDEFPSHADLLITVTRFASKNAAKKEAFSFTGSVAAGFVKAADFDKADIRGIRLSGRKVA